MPDVSASPFAIALTKALTGPRSRWGAIGLLVFIVVAITAPLICHDIAIIWWDDHGLRFPLLTELFNRRSYPNRHDLLFNLVLLLAAPVAVGWWLLGRWWSAARRIWVAVVVVGGIWVVCQVPLIPGRSGMQALWTDRPDPHETWQAHQAAESKAFSIFPLVPHRYDTPYQGVVLAAPGTVNPHTGSTFWLGTDKVGYDVVARLVFGARISLTIGLVATGIATLIGILIGAASGYFGGWVDLVLQRIVEIMLCFPVLVLVLVIVAMVGRNVFVIMVVLGLTGWAGIARLVRGEFLTHSVREYVLAAQTLGLPRSRIMFYHILPNALNPILISFTFGVAGSVFTESTLAFIGLGDPTAPSWGMLLDQGREFIHSPWLIYAPGAAIFLLLMSLNVVGNALREALDPKAVR